MLANLFSWIAVQISTANEVQLKARARCKRIYLHFSILFEQNDPCVLTDVQININSINGKIVTSYSFKYKFKFRFNN